MGTIVVSENLYAQLQQIMPVFTASMTIYYQEYKKIPISLYF